ncbi:MAG: hypothetical protein DYG88_01420 [Chloroflexi bacterium CFX4]|nr:hypothetical protein [Chloroflexi bacterium CFX4]MDL1921444.1 hypothetical protein [Chloroflexi bacterium CFX3]
MNTATLILIIAGSLAATLVLYAFVMLIRQAGQSGNSNAALWPPVFFLGEVRREPPPTAEVPRVPPVMVDAPPTAEFTRPVDLSQLDSTNLNAPSSAHTPPADGDIETTSRVSHILEEARRQAAEQPEIPIDRTSQFARPTPPSEDPDAQ